MFRVPFILSCFVTSFPNSFLCIYCDKVLQLQLLFYFYTLMISLLLAMILPSSPIFFNSSICFLNSRTLVLFITFPAGTPLSDLISYRSLLGALQHLTFNIPDVTFVVHQKFQFIHLLVDVHLIVIKCIFCYLQVTNLPLIDHGILFSFVPLITHSICLLMFIGLVRFWIVALHQALLFFLVKNRLLGLRRSNQSYNEAEYYYLVMTVYKLCWLLIILIELGIFFHHVLRL